MKPMKVMATLAVTLSPEEQRQVVYAVLEELRDDYYLDSRGFVAKDGVICRAKEVEGKKTLIAALNVVQSAVEKMK